MGEIQRARVGGIGTPRYPEARNQPRALLTHAGRSWKYGPFGLGFDGGYDAFIALQTDGARQAADSLRMDREFLPYALV